MSPRFAAALSQSYVHWVSAAALFWSLLPRYNGGKGFPQEIAHFARCVQGKETPVETGEDGREVLKIICAAYESAGTGKRIDWPYEPRNVKKPIDLWQRS